MKTYMSHYSAASYWNIPYLETVLGYEIDEASTVDYTVSERSARAPKKDQTIYLCEIDLPASAVVSRNGIMVASPELVFLQLASSLDVHRLILLGLQLCSHPPGKPAEAISTKHKLKTFLTKTSGHRGHRKALRATKYIENGSASIMESIVYMLLTLPHALGGYGLDGVLFNYEIIIKEEATKRLGQKRCYADIYYKQEKLAVEYNSFAFHNSPSEQGKDEIRSTILERQSIEVMNLSTIQLYDKLACKDFATNLATRLGRRIQIRTNKFDEMHSLLRTLLPKKLVVEPSEN